MASPKVSVVIAAWNRREDILQTLESVYGQNGPSLEVIVVDNGSTDGTCEAVSASFPEVRLLRLEENRGPTGGRNAGIRVARGEIMLCLDSDASPERGTLNVIVQKFESDPTIGVVNSKVINAYTRDFDTAAGWAYSEKQKAKSDQEFFSHNFSETGCAIRKAALEKAGLFWEKLFFGREGEELALRVLDAGYRILYCPSAVVLHRASPHKRIASTERKFYDFRNSLYIYLVRYPWWMLIWFIPMKILAESVKGFRQGTMDWIVRALSDVIRGLPSLWRERKPIRNETARIYLRFQKNQGSLSWGLISWLTKRT
jgi:GT2 family glycosyltransferase